MWIKDIIAKMAERANWFGEQNHKIKWYEHWDVDNSLISS